MQVINLDPVAKESHYNQRISGASSSLSSFAETVLEGKNDPANSASGHKAPASPLVSASVDSVLTRLQESGSVFDADDKKLMHARGVTDADRQRFAEIIQDAAEVGGYDDPISYVQSLSADDQNLLIRVHSLGDLSAISDITVEGAVNLLLPKRDHVDLNNDAVVETGAATTFYFPPPNSPQSVKDAWEATTKDMSFQEKTLAEAQFMLHSVVMNVKYDDDGRLVGFRHHTDPGYKNPFPTSEDEWGPFLDRMIDSFSKAAERFPDLAQHLGTLTTFQRAVVVV